MIGVALVSFCLALVCMPPSLDPAILLKEFTMDRDREKLRRGIRSSILPMFLTWAVFAFIGWLIIS